MCLAVFPSHRCIRAPRYGSGWDGVIDPLTPHGTLAVVQLSSCEQFMIYIPNIVRSVLDVPCFLSQSQVYAGPALWLRLGRGALSTDPHGTLAAVQLSSCDQFMIYMLSLERSVLVV
jgi:hypothetical protein